MRKTIVVLFAFLASVGFAQTHVAEKHYSTSSIQLKDVEVTDIVDTINAASTDAELPTAKSVYELASNNSSDLSEFEYLRNPDLNPPTGMAYFGHDTISVHKTDNRGIEVEDALIGAESLTIRTSSTFTSYPILEVSEIGTYYLIIIDIGSKDAPNYEQAQKVYMSFDKGSTNNAMGYEFLYKGGSNPPQEGEISVVDGLIRLYKSDRRGMNIDEVIEMATHIRIREGIVVHVYDIASITEETKYYIIYIA